MYGYKCHICGGICDPGELENGVCFACRSEDVRKRDERNCQTIRSLNQLMHAKYAEQHDGQMVMGGL